MIFVCEPQCKSFSHEKFNAGFLYGLRLAFSEEDVRFCGDASHIASLQNVLALANTDIENITYVPIQFRTTPGALRFMHYHRLLSHILNEALAAGTDKIFFLSYNPEILYLLKKLKEKDRFRTMKFTLVLHGGFESVAADVDGKEAGPATEPSDERTLLEKFRRSRLKDVPVKAVRLLLRSAARTLSPWKTLSKRAFSEKRMLLWNHSSDFRYISLSPHATQNARRYLDVEHLNIHTITLPVIFADPVQRPLNKFVKFAMFGYGDSSGLRRLLGELSKRQINAPYEIRIIGMDNRGTEEFPNVTCPNPGKSLERKDMEKFAEDIDMFLMVYGKNRYRLSCSGSIMEALSYLKPILHLDNECINHFNKDTRPIGVRSDDVQMMAARMHEIIESYPGYGAILDAFRQNMQDVRHECSIEQSAGALKASFTWTSSTVSH